jgi:hypothetical protein
MLRNFFGSLALIVSFISFVSLHSCSNHTNHALRHELSGRGILPLDLNNPYLAPNMFLSEEAKHSETLKGFLSLKGAPELLEFTDSLIGRPSLKLVYKTKNESYLLEEHGSDWIINGPENLVESEETKSLLAEKEGTPPLLTQGTTNSPIISVDNEKVKLPENLDDPDKGTKNKNEVVSSSRPSFKDIYHEVTIPGETITFVSYWFTGSIMNRERILRINSSLKENLKSGEIVRIPSYLANKDSTPTEEDFKKFISSNN